MSAAPAVCSHPEADFLELRYRADLHVLVARWQRAVSVPELRQGYRAMLTLAQAVACPFWQVDLRGRNAPDEVTRQWLVGKFVPRLQRCLGVPVCLGYLLTPRMLLQLGAPHASTAQVAFFSEEGPLAAWLRQCQQLAG